MGENTLTPQQMEALLAFAAKKLGVSQEQLARTLQSGRVGELGLSEENEKRLSTLLGNRQAVNDLLVAAGQRAAAARGGGTKPWTRVKS